MQRRSLSVAWALISSATTFARAWAALSSLVPNGENSLARGKYSVSSATRAFEEEAGEATACCRGGVLGYVWAALLLAFWSALQLQDRSSSVEHEEETLRASPSSDFSPADPARLGVRCCTARRLEDLDRAWEGVGLRGDIGGSELHLEAHLDLLRAAVQSQGPSGCVRVGLQGGGRSSGGTGSLSESLQAAKPLLFLHGLGIGDDRSWTRVVGNECKEALPFLDPGELKTKSLERSLA